MKKKYISPKVDIINTRLESEMLAGSPNNNGDGGDDTPGGGNFSKSFDMGEDEDWQNLDLVNNRNF